MILQYAKYYNVVVHEEPYLLGILKQAAETPLPPNWKLIDISETQNQERFVDTISEERHAQHPAHAYFEQLVWI